MEVPRSGRWRAEQDLRVRGKTKGSRGRASKECIWWKRESACSWRPWFTWEVNCLVYASNRRKLDLEFMVVAICNCNGDSTSYLFLITNGAYFSIFWRKGNA